MRWSTVKSGNGLIKQFVRTLSSRCSHLHLHAIHVMVLTLKVKVVVYSQVSSAKCHSLNFTQLPPGHRTCSFISHLNSPRSIQPGCHFQHTELFKHTSLHCRTRYPLTPGQESAHVGKMPCLGAQRQNLIQPSQGLNPQSLACKSCMLPLSHDNPL